ncbi:MAG: FecR domain-containing protein [Lachnospiraceae bacterium]|nr:FecR domain-containing protein [Lachnospiraceae bacterium]
MNTFKSFLSTKRGKIIAVCSGIGIILVLVLIFILMFSNKGYRSILVENVVGTTIIIGEKSSGEAYTGQRLFNGDDVTVKEASELILCIDNEKYLYAEENTHFTLEYASTKDSNKLKIVLDKGSELNELTQKLGPNDSYEVDTPNSTMSVKGTIFRVTHYKDTDGYAYTLLDVEEGVVLVRLKTINGEHNGIEKEFHAGESCLIRADENVSEFLRSKEGSEILTLDYLSLPEENVPRLIALIDRVEGNTIIDESSLDTLEDVNSEDDDKEDIKENSDKEEAGKESEEKESDKKESDKKESDKKESEKKEEAKKPAESSATSTNVNSESVNTDTSTPDSGSNSTADSSGSTPANNTPAETHTHSFSEWTIVTAPTCTTAGVKERVCSCGEKETASIEPTGHKWTTVTDSNPTCTSEGSKHDVCTVCGATANSVSIPMTEHTYITVIDLEPSCFVDGQKHEECSICHHIGSTSTTPKLGHHYVETNRVPGTDSNGNPGETITYTCDNPGCNASYNAFTIINP